MPEEKIDPMQLMAAMMRGFGGEAQYINQLTLAFAIRKLGGHLDLPTLPELELVMDGCMVMFKRNDDMTGCVYLIEKGEKDAKPN